MEKKVMNQPQLEKATMNKGFSAFDSYEDIQYWIKYVKNNSSFIYNSKTSECISILADALNRLNDKVKELEYKQRLLENNHVTIKYGTTE